MPPANQQSPVSPQAPRTSASKSKRAAKSDAAPSTTNIDEPVNSEAHLNSEAPNSDFPVNAEAASPQKQKRRRLVAAYDYDDLEPAHAVNSEPIPTPNSDPVQASPQKPARFKRRAQKPARAKVPITEITDFTVEEEQTPSTPVAENSQALMEQTTAEAGANISDPHTPLSDHGPSTQIPNSPMKIPEGAIVHDTAPENYRSDSEAQEKSAQDTVEKVADPIPETDKANSDADTDDDDSSDTDKDEDDGNLKKKD
ncbi:uncharacterized protein LOC135152807 [Daucus carota subsp. sativus]|uniref:uncharacterized protein LOC135152807 n=1 Tax=Daucus carota subsp. sativus TaxID=79200 RepID=UPI003082B9D7